MINFEETIENEKILLFLDRITHLLYDFCAASLSFP